MNELKEDFLTICDQLSQELGQPDPHFKIIESWDNDSWDFFGKAIALKAAELGIFQSILYQDSILYQSGFQLLNLDKINAKLEKWKHKAFRENSPQKRIQTGSFSVAGHDFQIFSSIHSVHNSKLILIFVIEKGAEIPTEKWKEFVQLIENLGFALGGKKNIYEPLFTDISERFLHRVQNELIESGTGVLTHFYIQDLNKYFENMGMQKSFEILKAIHTLLQSHLKKDDSFIHVSPRSIFTFSPRCTSQIVLERFEDVFIQVHHLIIDYRMRFREVTSDSDLKQVWSELVLDRN